MSLFSSNFLLVSAANRPTSFGGDFLAASSILAKSYSGMSRLILPAIRFFEGVQSPILSAIFAVAP